MKMYPEDYPIIAQETSSPSVRRERRSSRFSHVMRFTGHRTTVLFLTPSCMVMSAILVGIAVTRSRSQKPALDDNFWTAASQAILSLSSLYCILIPLLRSRAIPMRSFWFFLSFSVSGASCILSVAVYPFQWQTSVLLGFVSGVAQIISTMQLIEGIDTRIDDITKAEILETSF
jgi:hypothetical protein